MSAIRRLHFMRRVVPCLISLGNVYKCIKILFAHNWLACGLFSEIHFCHTVLCVWTNCALATPIICKVDLLRSFWKPEPRPCFIVVIYSCNAKCLLVWKSVTSISLSATSSLMESVDLCGPSPLPRGHRANRYSVLMPRANGGHAG